jgi:hypothetical protein
VSRDPDFIAKVKDVVGLYLAPPEHAVVLSVDEKTSIRLSSERSFRCRCALGARDDTRMITRGMALWTSTRRSRSRPAR